MKIWYEVISDLFVNLAAGWFGAIVIFPNFMSLSIEMWMWVIILDLIMGGICLRLALWFRMLGRRRKNARI